MNYFNRFIPRYSDVAAPLTDQTRDEAPRWTQRCTDAWNRMKTLLADVKVLYLADIPQCYGYILWDAAHDRLTTVAEYRRHVMAQPVHMGVIIDSAGAN